MTYFVHSPAVKISAYQHIQYAFSFARWRYSDLAVLEPTLIGTVITGYTTGYTGYYDRYLLNKKMQCAVSASFQTKMGSGDFDILSMPMTSTVTTKFNVTK